MLQKNIILRPTTLEDESYHAAHITIDILDDNFGEYVINNLSDLIVGQIRFGTIKYLRIFFVS